MLDRSIRILESFLSSLGRVVSLFVLAMIAVILSEIVVRGAFGRSLPWAGELAAWLMAGFIFLGAPWALAEGKFVRVDALFDTFPPRVRMWLDTIVASALFGLLAWVLIAKGGDFAMRAFSVGERPATGGWDAPVWIPKAMMPLGAVLLCLGWALHLMRGWRDLRTGTPDADDTKGSEILG